MPRHRRQMGTLRMYIVTLTYTRPLTEVDKHREAHLEWVRHQYESGRFLASGPRIPREGGVILVRDMPRENLDALLAEDPFRQNGVADFTVVAFKVSNASADLQNLLER